jgi:hypothetical protein
MTTARWVLFGTPGCVAASDFGIDNKERSHGFKILQLVFSDVHDVHYNTNALAGLCESIA